MKRLCLLLWMMLCSSLLLASEPVVWNGFVSQGIIKALDSNFVETDGDVSLKLTEVGLNASHRLRPNVRLAGQAVYLNGGNRYPEGVRVDYAFVDWQAVSQLDWQLNVHVGRFKNYHWTYSATRDVPHTRPSIILPQSIYFDVFRDVALGSDGIALISRTDTEVGDWEIIWSYGKTDVSRDQTRNLLGAGVTGELDQDFVHQFSLNWRPEYSALRIGLTWLDSDFDYWAGDNDVFVDGMATLQRHMLHIQYEQENWDFNAELFREKAVYSDLLLPGFFSNTTAEGGYVQGQYFVSADLTLLARLDLFDADRTDRDGRRREMLSGGTVPAYFGFMDQATIGMSYDIKPNWRVQAEYHRVKGAARLAPVFNPDVVNNNNKYWDIWAIQLMYWF